MPSAFMAMTAADGGMREMEFCGAGAEEEPLRGASDLEVGHASLYASRFSRRLGSVAALGVGVAAVGALLAVARVASGALSTSDRVQSRGEVLQLHSEHKSLLAHEPLLSQVADVEPEPEMTTELVTTTRSTTSKPKPLVSFFCFSVMKPESGEQVLLEYALKRRTSIFKCQAFAVVSSKKINLGPGDDGDVFTWYNPVPPVPTGQLGSSGVTTNSYLNTKTFMIAWGSLIDSGLLYEHDFTVKVDPDAVFLPDRLVKHVLPQKGKPVYFPNCNLWQGAPPYGPKLYGALEVYSVPAIKLYSAGHGGCEGLDWHGWGEDYYMQMCMIHLGVQGVADFGLVGDHRCINAPCSDGTRVAFHDFKDLNSYKTCFETAIGG